MKKLTTLLFSAIVASSLIGNISFASRSLMKNIEMKKIHPAENIPAPKCFERVINGGIFTHNGRDYFMKEFDTNCDDWGDKRLIYSLDENDEPSEYPIIYQFDKNGDGEYDLKESYLDVSEDGWNGNEVQLGN